MKDRDKIIRYYQGTDNGEAAARLIDLADAVVKGRPYRVSEFLPPFGVQIAETIRAHQPDLVMQLFGGYEGAERVKVAFVRNDYLGKIDYEISACKIVWDARYRLIGHRDVLGSLMGLGIVRERFGDIIMTDGGAQLLVDTSWIPYLQQNFTKVSMVGVLIEPMALTEILPREEKVKEVRTTVASLRLDAIAASGFGLSRTKTVEAINGDRVQINWQSAKGAAQLVQVGDVISLRGRGRMDVVEISGQSRKGRICVLLKRYM